ncbi:uncharacterized protein LOC143283834 [Babylonia areolata]|uniref:uncharacterized protein LOC143283834 n=1 Tax=Babylonia areolata TaxID=304850 RepID=UPI003FD60A99
MQALTLLPEKLRQRRKIRQRVLHLDTPRAAFADPKYGSTSRNFIFRIMATRKITPTPDGLPSSPFPETQEESPEEDDLTTQELSDGASTSGVDSSHHRRKPETPCQKVYYRACAKLRVFPSTSVYEHLSRSQMALPHSGMGEKEVKAVAIALVHNVSVHSLNVADNRLGSVGTAFLTEALRENRSLADLNLSNNALGSDGVKLLAATLLTNTSIVRVILSGNNIQDKDVTVLREMLERNRTLRELNLSHNHICHVGGTMLGQALAVNHTLRTLDVSWNHLRLYGAKAFCQGLALNKGLTRLHMAWNGLALEGCHELGKALATNLHLVELDVSANRVNGHACRRLLAGLRTNTALRCLRIGTNPITTESALSILLMLADDVTGLTELDLADVSVDSTFLALLDSVQEKRPLAVRYGVPLRHDDITPGTHPVVLDTDDPVTILFEFMRQKNLRLIDLLHNLDKDNSDTLSRDELRNGLLNIDIPLSSRSMDILMNKLDLNGDGHVDYEELAIGLKEYLRKAAKWKRQAESHPDPTMATRLEQIREAIRMRIEASRQRRGST